MGLLLLVIFLAVMLFFIVKMLAAVVAIIAIIFGGTMLIVLVSVWLCTSYFLRKSGYEPDSAQQAYRQVGSDLDGMLADLQEIRFGLDEAAPLLLDLEFLRYARENRETANRP